MFQDVKNFYHLLVALIANAWFGFSSKKLRIIGVTGTDGKTTTVSLVYHILKESGRNASMISSIGAIIAGKKYDIGFHVTTPSPFALQNFIKKAVVQGLRQENSFLVLEVTSHALDQYRVFGIQFEVGVITNVTREHLDYHRSYERYVFTKARLLKNSRITVLNIDDESYKYISRIKEDLLKRGKLIKTYGIKNNADVSPKNFSFTSNLFGEFNKYNILAAVTTCKELGLTDEEIKKGLSTYELPVGRGELVYRNDFSVMIDFAHTSNSFERILPEAKSMAEGRLIHVFGCAGQRDKYKRPVMGEISSKFADVIILTSEDPRKENVEEINEQIRVGIGKRMKLVTKDSYREVKNKKAIVLEIKDRKEAINFAISIAEKGDLVLLTGKSHEKSINYGEGEEPWNEHEVVRSALSERGSI